MNEYVTPDQLKTFLGMKDSDGNIATYNTMDERIIRNFCERASRAVDTWTRRHFYPLSETRYFDHQEGLRLWLDDDLLEVTTLTTANATETISSDDYFLIPYSGYPKYRIDLDTSAGETFYVSDTLQRSEAVTGIWGYHHDWDNAWVDSGDDLAAAVSSTTATSITVGNATGDDVYGRGPRFQVCQLLKIEDEYLYIYEIPSPSTLYVRRGVNGTTAATHDSASDVYTFEAEPEITLGLQMYARYLYRQRDSNVTEVTSFPEMGIVQAPAGLPKDVRDIVTKYTRGDMK